MGGRVAITTATSFEFIPLGRDLVAVQGHSKVKSVKFKEGWIHNAVVL